MGSGKCDLFVNTCGLLTGISRYFIVVVYRQVIVASQLVGCLSWVCSGNGIFWLCKIARLSFIFKLRLQGWTKWPKLKKTFPHAFSINPNYIFWYWFRGTLFVMIMGSFRSKFALVQVMGWSWTLYMLLRNKRWLCSLMYTCVTHASVNSELSYLLIFARVCVRSGAWNPNAASVGHLRWKLWMISPNANILPMKYFSIWYLQNSFPFFHGSKRPLDPL